MGKDLKGKELGEGVCQLKSGKYCARVSGITGRISKTFDRIIDAKIWVAERQNNRFDAKLFGDRTTLNEWYESWINDIKKPVVKIGTYQSYKDLYEARIRDTLGYMPLKEIKPIHVQQLINNEAKKHKSSTVMQTLICLKQMFESAVDNGMIEQTPITKTVKVKSGENNERRVLTADEQVRLTQYIQENGFTHDKIVLFILETGLRFGELLGLKWSDIDFKGRMIHVNRSMCWVSEYKAYVEVTPKTKAGARDIPMTDRAYEILKSITVSRIDHIFFTPKRNGKFDINSSLNWLCKRVGIEKISVHGLRHSFATRCIECGMRPKTLQKIMGHSSLSVTMDLYVHVTEDTMIEEMKKLIEWEKITG